MSTPRTDAFAQVWGYSNDGPGAIFDFACTLERESAAKDATIARLREALEFIAAWEPSMAPNEPGGMSIMEAIDTARAALAVKE